MLNFFDNRSCVRDRTTDRKQKSYMHKLITILNCKQNRDLKCEANRRISSYSPEESQKALHPVNIDSSYAKYVK